MTILALLAGLLASHFLPKLELIRNYSWLSALVGQARKLGDAAWLAVLATIVVPVIIAVVLGLLAELALGDLGFLVLGVLVVIYTLGPRDLDRDLKIALDDAKPDGREVALEHLQLDSEASGQEAAAAVLHASLSRWFGIVFWFAVLGPAGALLYRCARIVGRDPGLKQAERRWIGQLVYVLNWPVVALMVTATALMADFDRTFWVWRGRDNPWQLDPDILDELAAALRGDGDALDEGIKDGRRLVWRMLGLWLAVLSLLLLAGWLA